MFLGDDLAEGEEGDIVGIHQVRMVGAGELAALAAAVHEDGRLRFSADSEQFDEVLGRRCEMHVLHQASAGHPYLSFAQLVAGDAAVAVDFPAIGFGDSLPDDSGLNYLFEAEGSAWVKGAFLGGFELERDREPVEFVLIKVLLEDDKAQALTDGFEKLSLGGSVKSTEEVCGPRSDEHRSVFIGRDRAGFEEGHRFFRAVDLRCRTCLGGDDHIRCELIRARHARSDALVIEKF